MAHVFTYFGANFKLTKRCICEKFFDLREQIALMMVKINNDRIVDGKEAVSFLVKIKECIENPERILLEI